MATTELPNECPWCGVVNDMATGIDSEVEAPTPGAVSICWRCTGIAVFTDELTQRKPTDQEAAELAMDSRFMTVLDAVVKAKEGSDAKDE